MKIERKISVGGINNVRKGFKEVKATTFVARIMGIARSAKMEEGANGAFWKFGGEFRAVNMDGEESASPVAFLPTPADGMLADAVQADKTSGGVQFGFDFYLEPREDVAIGYSYIVKPLFESKPSDPLAAMMANVKPLEIAPKAEQLQLETEQPQTEAETKPAKTAKK